MGARPNREIVGEEIQGFAGRVCVVETNSFSRRLRSANAYNG